MTATAVVSVGGPEGPRAKIEATDSETVVGRKPPKPGVFKQQHPDSPKREPTGQAVSPEPADVGRAPTVDRPPTPQPSEAAASAAPEATDSAEDEGTPPSVGTKPGTELSEAPGVSPDPEAAADLPVARAELGVLIAETAAVEEEASAEAGAPAEGKAPTAGEEATPEAPNLSGAEPEPISVSTSARKGFEQHKLTETAAAIKREENPEDPAVAHKIQENALNAHYQARAVEVENSRRIGVVRNSAEYKTGREVALRSIAAKLKPGDIVDEDAVDRQTLMNYLKAQDEDRDKPRYRLRQFMKSKKPGFIQAILEAFIAVGLSTGEQVGTQSVTPLQPGRT